MSHTNGNGNGHHAVNGNGNGKETYDVTILGAGIAGSILAAILAKQGVKTLLIDSASHPRFAIGESTIPQTLCYMRTLAARYGIPEIKTLSNLNDCAKYIGPTHGRKAHFGFMIHHEGQSQQPRECTLFNAPKLLAEAHHLFRQDTDAYIFHAAIRYGAVARQNVRIEDVEFDDTGVTLGAVGGETFRTRYVVDATGARSLLADKLGKRDKQARFKHHSRSLWTHMQGVPHTDSLFPRSKADTPPKAWYEGTVHHMFERGWYWVIAFDNNEFSKSPLCSVGLTLDERLYPRNPDEHPHDEFMRIASKYPDIERQYRGAVPVREWTTTDRIQWSSSDTVGDRWCLLGHAAGFIDPLFSFGMSNTLSAVSALVPRLVKGLKEDDLSRRALRVHRPPPAGRARLQRQGRQRRLYGLRSPGPVERGLPDLGVGHQRRHLPLTRGAHRVPEDRRRERLRDARRRPEPRAPVVRPRRLRGAV